MPTRVCIYVCMHSCMQRTYVLMYVRTYVCMYVRTCACMCACARICMHSCMHALLHACLLHECLRVCICTCMHACTCVPRSALLPLRSDALGSNDGQSVNFKTLSSSNYSARVNTYTHYSLIIITYPSDEIFLMAPDSASPSPLPCRGADCLYRG